MSARVAVVGGGMMGAAVAWELARRGVDVTVFERGPDYPYPHREPFVESVEYDWYPPSRLAPPDLHRTTSSGTFVHDFTEIARVGGNATVWQALTPRIGPDELRTRSAFGYGIDWPLAYADLEPWLCRAEAHLGVSGTDADNPWAPPRTRPYPLPPFELTPDDALLAERLAADGVHVHTTPQARTRLDYDGRPACMNYGTCHVCPTGSRYSPNHHLGLALGTGHCVLRTDCTVRRVLTDASGRATGVLVRANGDAADREVPAAHVVLAGAALESARLLLLSKDPRHPDGLGNAGGHVGRNLVFHHIWNGHAHYRDRLFAGRVGYWTGQSEQFCHGDWRGKRGAVKVEFASRPFPGHLRDASRAPGIEEAVAAFAVVPHCRQVAMHAESVADARKYVGLSRETDRYGDPVAHVQYDSCAFDRETHAFSRALFERLAKATRAYEWEFPELEDFGVAAHYMGTCRMSARPGDGVVDALGRVHGAPGAWVCGTSVFAGSGGAANPTLTGVALALRAADAIVAGAGA